MVAPRSGRLRVAGTACGVLALATLAVLACASSPDPAPTTPQGSAEADRLTDVRVESGEGGSIITLMGLKDPVYTAFLHSEPRALVLDIAAVEIATPNDLVMVYDGLVENVTVSTYGGSGGESLTRVEIALSQDAAYEIASTDDGLQAVLRSGDSSESAFAPMDGEPSDEAVSDDWASELGTSEATAEDASAEDFDPDADPWSDPQAEEVGLSESSDEPTFGDEPTFSDEPTFEEEVSQATPATMLTAVHHTETQSGVLVHLEADGAIGAVESFTLENPDRFVVDLPGLKSQAPVKTSVGTAYVSRVRVGAHPNKVRVVIDGGAGAGGFQERQISPAADGLYLALGSGSDLDAAMNDALDSSATSSFAVTEPVTEPVMEEDVASLDFEELVVEEDFAAADTEEPVADDWEAIATAEPEIDWEADSQPVAEPVANTFSASFAKSLEKATAQVYGIHYDSEDDYERVVILSDTLVDYDLYSPDGETLVVSIPSARVSPEATGRVTARPKRPISLISTFQQPDVATPEVRVVVKHAAGLKPSIVRRGSMIFLDFPNNGLVAAPPPAFATEQEWVDAGLGGEISSAPVADDGSMIEAPTMEISDGPAAMSDSESLAAFDPTDADLSLDVTGSRSGSPAALEPPAAVEILEEGGLIDGKEYEGRRISLDFKDVPVADVLRLIAEVSDLNLIAGDEVEGSVTIRLVDVPWDQALDVILLTKGLGFVRVGSVLRIAPADIIKAEEELRLQERRNKETLEDLVVKLQPVNYANVADMSQLVKRLLTPRGTVNVDVRTNTLIMKDIPSVIDEATALIKAIDTETPQVLIEAKIVEAALDFSRELGSVWSAGTNELEDGFSGNAPRRDLGGPDFRFHDANNVIFGNPITSVPTGVMNMSAFVLNENFNIEVQIQAAESTGDGKVISSPRILTLDNREAEIQQGVSIPFQTFENGDAKLEFIDAVLSLLVTPHVTSDKTIIMQIEVTRNAPDDSVPTPTGSPAIARAEARTETLVKDGQTLVIGGIYTINESERESRVPYLHRLPLIGSAFKSREVTDQRKELLIFVTPRIVLASELAGN
jgi:type IV pilus secretin PilQ/predicted competence protein